MGSFTHSLDPKKRLTVPSDWRDKMSDPRQLFIMPGINEPMLYAFPEEEMARRLAAVASTSIADADAARFARVLGARSELVGCDVQGRIRVKDELLAHAGLTDRVVMVGAFQRIELWSPERWAEYDAREQAALEDAVRHTGF